MYCSSFSHTWYTFVDQSSPNLNFKSRSKVYMTLRFTSAGMEINGMKVYDTCFLPAKIKHYCFPASTRISFRKCKLSVDLCEWLSKIEGRTFHKQHFFISLGVQEMSVSSVTGSDQAASTQLHCLRSHKYIWLCWLPDVIKAAKALKRWCLRDPRLHWSEMRLRLCWATLTSPPCIYKWRGGYNECQPNLCLLI